MAHIRRNPVDHWAITVYKHGATKIAMQGAAIEPAPGVPFIVSLANENAVERRSSSCRVQFHLARDKFGEIATLLDAVCGAALDTPLGKLLGEYMLLLERSLPSLKPADVPRLTGAVRAMVAACLVPSADRLSEAGGQIGLSRMEMVRRTVSQHLRSPVLGAEVLCSELSMSRSHLYRLLEKEGGVIRYIRRRRLAEAYVALSDLSAAKSVAAIARELCFDDASAFSRALRREFGMSPSDARTAFHAGLTPIRPKDCIGLEVRSFGDCLNAC
jgi:AraC-like DNA-binding protein